MDYVLIEPDGQEAGIYEKAAPHGLMADLLGGRIPAWLQPVPLDGSDLRDLALPDLRRAVAVVTQRPVLFSATLRENLTLARPDAPWDDVL